MNTEEIKTQLTNVLQNLPTEYSQNGARKLMSSFENYKHIAQGLRNNYPIARSGVTTEFGDIESDIKLAIIGTPKKEAEARFIKAKRHITEDINGILTAAG